QPRSRRRGKDRTGAARQAKFRSRNKGDRYERPPADASPPSSADAPLIAPSVTQSDVADVTPPARVTAPGWHDTPAPTRAAERHPRYASIPLAVIAYWFFALGVSINIWNAMTGGPIANMILPAAMGVLAEAVMFFLPVRTLSLPLTGKLLAWTFLAFVAAFA